MTTETLPEILAPVPREKWPKHIAIIMDGNGRWAERQDLPRIEGHRRGVNSVRSTTEECARLKLEQLTLYCLSSENWKRPQPEIDFLMSLLEQYMIEERSTIMDNNVRVRMIGRRTDIPQQVLNELDKTVEMSQQNDGMWMNLAINYGARAEMVDAVRSIGSDIAAGNLTPEGCGRRNHFCPSLHGRSRRPRLIDPHGRGNADQQLSALADQLRGDLGHTKVLAGIRYSNLVRSDSRFCQSQPKVRRTQPVNTGSLISTHSKFLSPCYI